jgi:hypothetical protein
MKKLRSMIMEKLEKKAISITSAIMATARLSLSRKR